MGDAEKSGLPRGTDLTARLAVVAVALLVGGVIFWLRFCGEVDLPARPPAPAVVESTDEQAGDAWTRQVADDARSLRLQRPPGRDEMAAPFPHQVDEARHRLQTGGSIDSAGLRIAVVDVDGTQAVRVDNLLAAPVAYRVDARPVGCRTPRRLNHNALALSPQGSPGASAVRGLCAARSGGAVLVTRVETMRLPPLGYHYIGRLRPGVLGLNEEWIGSHQYEGELGRCDLAVPAWLQGEIDGGRTSWRDLVDFYASHSCEKYQFPRGYRAVTEGARTLP